MSDSTRVISRMKWVKQLTDKAGWSIINSDMFDLPAQCAGERFALALLMAGRLLEVDASRTVALRQWLASNCDRILVYAYGDWLTRYGSLAGLIEQVGGFRLQTGADATAGFVVCTEPSAG